MDEPASRVLCWVPIRNYTEDSILRQIEQTWGKYCNKLVFTAQESIPLNRANLVKLAYRVEDDLWNMIHPAWTFMYLNFAREFDWFVKVDDDTYFNARNFQYLVRDFNATRDFYYLGHGLHGAYLSLDDPTGKFNLGGAYAISRHALLQVGPHLPDVNATAEVKKCRRSKTWAEDIVFSNCLRTIGGGSMVYPNNSRDAYMRNHFMLGGPFNSLQKLPQYDENDTLVGWEFKGIPREAPAGVNCCASRPVSWHLGKGDRKGTRILIDYLLASIYVDPIISGFLK